MWPTRFRNAGTQGRHSPRPPAFAAMQTSAESLVSTSSDEQVQWELELVELHDRVKELAKAWGLEDWMIGP